MIEKEESTYWTATRPEEIGHTVLKLSYVTYPEENFVCKCFGIITLSPLYVMAALFGVFVTNKNIKVLHLAAGLVVSTVFNGVLKDYFREHRPAGSPVWGYGFPSDHSQFMGFFCAFCILAIFFRSAHLPGITQLMLCTIVSGWTVAVLLSRYILRAHSFKQIFCGCGIGIFTGGLWYMFMTICESWLCKDLQIFVDRCVKWWSTNSAPVVQASESLFPSRLPKQKKR